MSSRIRLRSLTGHTPSLLGTLALFGLVGGLGGCGNIEPVAPSAGPVTEPTQLYMALTLDHPAVNLSTAAGYNTLQLTATPRDALGNPMSGLPAPIYTSSDTTAVGVTADGLLTAVGIATEVKVVAELVDGLVRHVDTATVNVTNLALPPVPASLSIDPVWPDSAIRAMRGNYFTGLGQQLISEIDPSYGRNAQLVPQAVDASNNAIDGLAVEYLSLDPTIVTVERWTGQVKHLEVGTHPGVARLVARTMAYGTTKADTLAFTITMPVLQHVRITSVAGGQPRFGPGEIRIAPYGFVFWLNPSADSVDVTFDGPTNMIAPQGGVCDIIDFLITFTGPGPNCGVGDMLVPPKGSDLPDLGLDGTVTTIQVRQFPLPGIYPYHSTRTGETGRIVVTTELE